MKNIVLLLTSLNDLNNPYVDSLLIPIKGLSSRSQYELDIDEVLNIKKNKALRKLPSAKLFTFSFIYFFSQSIPECPDIHSYGQLHSESHAGLLHIDGSTRP